MPAKSKAQMRKMFVLFRQGKITKKQLDDFTGSGVNYKKLPARKTKKKPKRKKR